MLKSNSSDPIFAYDITLYSVGTIIFICNLTTNVLFIAAVIKRSWHKRKIYVVILSWTGADLLLGLSLFIQIATAHIEWIANDVLYPCLFWNGIQLYPVWVGCAHMVICAVDRFIIVLYPNKYENRVSWTRLRMYLLLSWAYALLWTAIVFLWYNSDMESGWCNLNILSSVYIFLFVMLHYIPACVACLFLYVKVFMHFRRHERQVHVTHTLTQDELVINTKLAQLLLLASILFPISWLPFCIVSFARASPLPVTSDWHVALLYTFLIGNIGSVVKMPLFATKNSEFRSGLKKVLGIKKKPLQFGASLRD